MITGHYKEALEFCDAAIEKFPEEHWIHWLKGQTYLLMGNAEEARSEFLLYYSKGEKTADDDYTMKVGLGLTYLYEGKLETAHAEYGEALEIAQGEKSFESMGSALQNLGKILTYKGKYDEAIAAFESAEKISWERKNKDFNPYPIFSYYHTGRVHVQRRDFASAKTFSEKIKRYIQEHDLGASYLDYSYFLEGYIHAAQGTSSGVRDALDKCSGPQKIGPEYNELSALSSILMNEFDQAIEKYSRFKTNIYLSRYGNDWSFFYRCSSLADYNLGKIHEQQGNTAKAIEHYEKFLELWKDADPGIAEVDDARERLAGLKGM
jgi:tetratricopeptide (TPR) repeat protein